MPVAVAGFCGTIVLGLELVGLDLIGHLKAKRWPRLVPTLSGALESRFPHLVVEENKVGPRACFLFQERKIPSSARLRLSRFTEERLTKPILDEGNTVL